MHHQKQKQMHQLPQQQLAHLWFYNQWTMLPDNRYGVPQNEMDQNWFIPNPSSKHSLCLVLTNSYAAEQYLGRGILDQRTTVRYGPELFLR